MASVLPDRPRGEPSDEERVVPRRTLRLAPRLILSAIVPGVLVWAVVFAAVQWLPWLSARATHLWPAVALSGAMAAGLGVARSARHVSHRVARVAAMLRRMQEGDYATRADVTLADELGVLTHRVNRLAEAAADRERRISERALMDSLTGLPNRTLLTDRIRQAVRICERTRGKFALMVLDLDRFKFVNDTLGHAVGDQMLKEVAGRLSRTVRDTDSVARLGGDEFVVLISGGADLAREVAERIQKAMREPMQRAGESIDIGASIGIAIYPEHGQESTTLLRHADAAMYRAKRQQTGFQFFDGNDHEVRRSHLSMLSEMRAALDAGQFEVDYQPKLDLRTGLIVGVEGLVRWNHPTRGRVQPGEFIPFAEQTGFMRVITRWVVAEGARFAYRLRQAGLDVRVSLNVTALDIQQPDFAEEVGGAVAKAGLKPGQICLEITESGVVSEAETALATLRAVARQGVMLSVDDFGTGYATLKQLQQLPVHELKIDRSFVTGMTQNRGSEPIVRATIDMAKQLGLRVVAEGVETFAEMRALAALGCDEAQGYFIAKPMPEGEVVDWIEQRHSLATSSKEQYFNMLAASPDVSRPRSAGDAAANRGQRAPASPAPLQV